MVAMSGMMGGQYEYDINGVTNATGMVGAPSNGSTAGSSGVNGGVGQGHHFGFDTKDDNVINIDLN